VVLRGKPFPVAGCTMRNDDNQARRKAEEDPELREGIQRSVQRDDEREPTSEKLEKPPSEAANEEAQDASPITPALALSPSADSSANGNRRGGPSSPEGKAISRTNATTHGIFSSVVVLRLERLQRIRKGQPVPPRLEVGFSV
jgi:hypothetical protein